ncbi:MAG: family 1 encapsulin nanocompartment shell protein, partial [Stellaceae bacterium]
MDYLNRAQAPFPAEIWAKLDGAAVEAARERLSARRFLPVEGPYGIGLTAIECGNDEVYRQPRPSEAAAVLSRTQPVPMIRQVFRLSIRRIAAATEHGQPLDLAPVEDAAEAVADREEELVYRGERDMNLQGLTTSDGHLEVATGDWGELTRALDDVLAAATRLDEHGYRG